VVLTLHSISTIFLNIVTSHGIPGPGFDMRFVHIVTPHGMPKSYLRLIDFVYHSTLGLKVTKKTKKNTEIGVVPKSRCSHTAGFANNFNLFSRYKYHPLLRNNQKIDQNSGPNLLGSPLYGLKACSR